MKGDFSRDSFQPMLQFSRVLMQQGRVLLDADWNEQNAILLNLLRTLTADMLGPHAGPGGDLGFAVYSSKSDLNALPEVLRKAVEELRQSFKKPGNVVIGPGRYYVDGMLCGSAGPVPFHAQPGRLPAAEPESAARLLYLEAWERHVNAYQAPGFHEVALGDIDTTTRAQVVWQVRALETTLATRDEAEAIDEAGLPAWRAALNLRPKGRMAARTMSGNNTSDLCELPAEAQYRGRDNRLYRVEVHAGGDLEAPVEGDYAERRPARERKAAAPDQSRLWFKWSRDNGSIAVPVESFPESSSDGPALVRVRTLGRDPRSGIAVGAYVELVDDEDELGLGAARPLGKVQAIDPLEQLVEVDALPTVRNEDALHPLLRRWDGHGAITFDTWIPLEDGIQVRFLAGSYRAGDYWLIPARAGVPGDILWPQDPDSPEPEGLPLDPHGITRHYAPLALIDAGNVVTDLRCAFDAVACYDPSRRDV